MNDLKANPEEGENDDTKRRFLKLGMGALTPILLPGIIWNKENSLSEKSSKGSKYLCLDYRRSFICNTAEFNSVRMWIES